MISTTSGPIPSVERFEDLVALACSDLVVTGVQARPEPSPRSGDEQFFVEWEVPQGS